MQARKTVQGKIVEKKIVCRTDEQIKLVKENCSSVRGFNPAKSDSGKISKLILDKVNHSLKDNFKCKPMEKHTKCN